MEDQISRILDHRQELRIFRDEGDGYHTIDALNRSNQDSRLVDNASVVTGFGFTLWSALGDLEGNLMQFDQRP